VRKVPAATIGYGDGVALQLKARQSPLALQWPWQGFILGNCCALGGLWRQTADEKGGGRSGDGRSRKVMTSIVVVR
jgi:hypothetical protein